MLVGAIDRRVHADRPVDLTGSVRVGKDLSEDLVPGAVAAEAEMSLPCRLPRPEFRRQIPPRRARPEPPHDALDHPTMILERPTGFAGGQRHQRLDPSPRGIRKRLSTRHVPKPAANRTTS